MNIVRNVTLKMSPRFDFICKYCNHSFHEYFYGNDQAENVKCGKCGDKNLKIIYDKNQDSDPYGYRKDKQVKDAYVKED